LAAVELEPVEGLERRLAVILVDKLHEREAARAACFAVHYDRDAVHRAAALFGRGA